MNESHLDELLAAKYLDQELEEERAMDLRDHLNSCEACRQLLAETESALGAFRSVHRSAAPGPPRPWADLRPLLNKLDAEQIQARVRPFTIGSKSPKNHGTWWWAAAAASVAMGVLALRLTTSQTVSAAELLQKASAREVPVSRIQVKTRARGFVRTSGQIGDAELARMFQEANFDWQQPLRPSAFASWRDSLKEKQDDVRTLDNPDRRIGRFFWIRTSTPEGALREVSIMIRAADYRAVEERFEFRNNEWVEIIEAPAQAEVPPATLAAEPPGPDRPAIQAATPADELRVYAALHKIGADLGEPIEVIRKEQSVDVTVLGATARREKEIRAAIEGLPNVALKFEQPQAVSAPSSGGSAVAEGTAGALHSHLLNLMGTAANVEAFTNSALEQSEAAVARAHAIRHLSERFGNSGQLSADDKTALARLESDHARVLRETVRRLAEILQPLTAGVATSAGNSASNAQTLLGAAQRLDTMLTVALASSQGAGNPEETVRSLAQALAELERLAREYRP